MIYFLFPKKPSLNLRSKDNFQLFQPYAEPKLKMIYLKVLGWYHFHIFKW
ncbi:hypothetical protein LEP1GSC079_4722 [Leptospira interrogans str. FPW1039]|uniref:Uncharacterized protein n=1 Tax=Leptospira interrogans str. FPW1039 TaxID=1193040 RepID=A0A0F6I9V4_LEPIR|nr:hypothetical protein LEP1GSC096_0920 [Leptospira interrogans serovar Hebdomadis str. R499]EKR82328.1 hypothetical protein LEP1GSC099_1181 [Leptospira interrogans str. UI 08452]EMJ34829.1 hypothetical protein LEP1GSC079_4722 [Leptospira interrogans str. FPW1039]EMN33081.1 hypothetical protein LEP1GSC084_1429 [Leptospira interrogans serovar Medanensis str. L0448]EMN39659.1 hypothetical protein LEP1GSC085_0543 [Leptospira interrogans str. L0996]EMO94135.1 hypothetical protein LEP1GSC109_1021 [